MVNAVIVQVLQIDGKEFRVGDKISITRKDETIFGTLESFSYGSLTLKVDNYIPPNLMSRGLSLRKLEPSTKAFFYYEIEKVSKL